MYEKKRRTAVKMLTFKIATVINAFVWTAIFGLPFIKALPAAICMNLTGLGLYYLKERIWNKIKWGRIKHDCDCDPEKYDWLYD